MTEQESLVWSLTLSSSNLAVFVLTGRLSRRLRVAGWVVAVATEPLWAYYGYLTGGWAFLVLAAFYVAVAGMNLWTLHRVRADP